MWWPGLSLNVQQRLAACVLDPALALSPFGPPLVSRLGRWLELWLPREVWALLDSSDCLRGNPELWREMLATEPPAEHALEATLAGWQRLRLGSDRGEWPCHWLADRPSESALPAGAPSGLAERHELLARCLTARFADAPPLAALDTLALAATLGPIPVLAMLQADGTPALASVLVDAGFACQPLPAGPMRSLALIERAALRNLLSQLGFAALPACGLRLAILHLWVPAAALADQAPRDTADSALAAVELAGAQLDYAALGLLSAPPEVEPWEGATAYWYAL